MSDMLTAKDIQEMLKVDRSTIYRMAETGRLPALKVGRQWRFSADTISRWMQIQSHDGHPQSATSHRPTPDIELPIAPIQHVIDIMAELLGVMIVLTDMEGHPITDVSNPCGLFQVVNDVPGAVRKCIDSWHTLASDVNLATRFQRSHLGLLCARGFVRVGSTLQGMVFAGGIAPDNWPPEAESISGMAHEFGVSSDLFEAHIDQVYHLDPEQRRQLLKYVERISTTISLMVGSFGQAPQ
jgi:excisionase family DNA binding protein